MKEQQDQPTAGGNHSFKNKMKDMLENFLDIAKFLAVLFLCYVFIVVSINIIFK